MPTHHLISNSLASTCSNYSYSDPGACRLLVLS